MTKKAQIIQSASEIVAQNGVSQLTLEAVAERAGVSKGGLLYHFSNKDKLIEAMLESYILGFEERIERFLSTIPQGTRARWLKAFVLANFEDITHEPSLVSVGLAALVNHPSALARMHEYYVKWMSLAQQDGISAEMVTLVIAASDGVYLNAMLGIGAFSDSAQERLRETLIRLIEGD